MLNHTKVITATSPHMGYFKRYKKQEEYRPILDNKYLTYAGMNRSLGYLKSQDRDRGGETATSRMMLIVPPYLKDAADLFTGNISRYQYRAKRQSKFNNRI